MRAVTYILVCLLLHHTLFSQEIIPGSGMENGTNLNIVYKQDMSGKIYANTRGYGFTFHRGKHVTVNSRSFYELDFQTLKHPKEVKSSGVAEERKNYVYGKVNSVLVFRPSIGMQNVLFTKADSRAVEVRYSYAVGPVLAFAKPYYVNVYKTRGIGLPLNNNYVNFGSENFNSDSGVVVGRAPFVVGLNEIKIYPGASARFNVSFEYAPYTNLIRAIETGVCLDYYPKALPLMARNPSENLVLSLYVGFVFGSKWF